MLEAVIAMKLDRRVRHFTHDNVRRMLARAGIEHVTLTATSGNRTVVALAYTPSARQLMFQIGFSYSAKHQHHYRSWQAGE